MASELLRMSKLSAVASVCGCLLLTSTAFCQRTTVIPPELQASDTEVRNVLTTAQSEAESGEYERAVSNSQQALKLANDKKLVADRSIAEESLASAYFASGNSEDSMKYYQASLQDAIDSSNLVLQADVLVALSSFRVLQGNLAGALELLGKAKNRADESKSQYIRSRALGELGHTQVLSGQVALGEASIDEALNIDKVNGYTFEPLHTVYAAYAKLAETQPDVGNAISLLEAARNLAVEDNNYLALLEAQNGLGSIYVHNGNVEKGIATLEATLNGNILRDDRSVLMPESFRKVANLPVLKAAMLENLAQGYEAVHKPDEALRTWDQMYMLSSELMSNLMLAEAASQIARIHNSEKDFPDALNFYDIAIKTWRILQNDQQLSQNLVSEALLLIQLKKGEAAIPLEIEAAEIAEKTQNRPALFSAYGVLSEIYQPMGRFQEARSVLEKATSLIDPGPGDSEISSGQVVESYTFLADDYRALQLPIKELIALEKAVAVLQKQKDDAALPQLLTYLKGRIEALQVQDKAVAAAEDGQLIDSLWYSEILYFWNGVPGDPMTDANWNRVLNLPFRIAQQPDGSQSLDEILVSMDSLIGIARLPILDSLSSHFLTSEPRPTLGARPRFCI